MEMENMYLKYVAYFWIVPASFSTLSSHKTQLGIYPGHL